MECPKWTFTSKAVKDNDGRLTDFGREVIRVLRDNTWVDGEAKGFNGDWGCCEKGEWTTWTCFL